MRIGEGLNFKTKRKYIETQGSTIGEKLVRKDSNPEHYGRDQCFCCRTAPGACTRQGAVYAIMCVTC